MRTAYQRCCGYPIPTDRNTKLTAFFAHNPPLLDAMMPGWYGYGRKRDVPKDACYVGNYCQTYVWVLPDHVEYLTRLSLAILDIATAVSSSGQRLNPIDSRVSNLEAELKTLTDIYKTVSDPSVNIAQAVRMEYGKVIETKMRLLDQAIKQSGAVHAAGGGMGTTALPESPAQVILCPDDPTLRTIGAHSLTLTSCHFTCQ